MLERLEASVLPEPLKCKLKEVVFSLAGVFLMKGDPIKPLVDHYHSIETTWEP